MSRVRGPPHRHSGPRRALFKAVHGQHLPVSRPLWRMHQPAYTSHEDLWLDDVSLDIAHKQPVVVADKAGKA